MPLRYGCYVWNRLINLELDPGIGISLQKTVIGEIQLKPLLFYVVFSSQDPPSLPRPPNTGCCLVAKEIHKATKGSLGHPGWMGGTIYL